MRNKEIMLYCVSDVSDTCVYHRISPLIMDDISDLKLEDVYLINATTLRSIATSRNIPLENGGIVTIARAVVIALKDLPELN